MPDLDLTELARLESAATPAPWKRRNTNGRPSVWMDLGDNRYCKVAAVEAPHMPHALESHGRHDNAEFLAALRNAAPALLTTARNHERLLAAVRVVCTSSNPLAALAELHDVYEALTKEGIDG